MLERGDFVMVNEEIGGNCIDFVVFCQIG